MLGFKRTEISDGDRALPSGGYHGTRLALVDALHQLPNERSKLPAWKRNKNSGSKEMHGSRNKIFEKEVKHFLPASP
jgi:hypothetical protein